MRKAPISLSGGSFNTLAQNETDYATIFSGKGTDLNDGRALKGRAKRKLITQKMVLNLIDVVDKARTPEDKKGYWNTYHCQNRLYSANGKLYGKYCKNRFCTLCCSIRKAHIINKYLPVVKSWPKPTFVTLTIKSIPARKLRYYIFHMLRAFKIINSRYRKKNQRGKGVKLIGIKSLECNFNPSKRTYNPHFHFIVSDTTTAEILVSEWLTLWTKKFTLRVSQNIKPVNNNERALIEIVKYGSKIFTEPDVNDKAKSIVPVKIHVAALNNIFMAMKGFRIFERFGFNLPKEIDDQGSKYTVVKNYDEWAFEPKSYDWINNKSGQKLTDFDPHWHLIELLQNHIDKDLK
jgi:hypothetical protein